MSELIEARWRIKQPIYIIELFKKRARELEISPVELLNDLVSAYCYADDQIDFNIRTLSPEAISAWDKDRNRTKELSKTVKAIREQQEAASGEDQEVLAERYTDKL